mmetsp:Transcript_53329/g.98611  ORF Transcript_53329/g.98611 Transcript_53329/m.98611 type:complete len:360 (-) Transcript_53329:36-1115(-)
MAQLLSRSRRAAVAMRKWCLLGSGAGLLSASVLTPANASCATGSEQHQAAADGESALRVRLVQYNVRGMTTDTGEPAVQAVAGTLSALSPTVVCLNEVDERRQPTALRVLAEEAGFPFVHFFGHVQGRYGNALLSRARIVQVQDIHLDGGTMLEWPPGSGKHKRIARGMLAATLELAAGTYLTVYCTHLDHISEKQRMVQMTHILQATHREKQAEPHVLVGDLNALRVDDYTPTEWAALERKAITSGWAPPVDAGCLQMLQKEGYVDAFEQACSARGEASLQHCAAAKFTAHIDAPMYRIDYIMISPEAQQAGVRVQDAFIDETAAGSDHFPLVVDLVWKAPRKAPPESHSLSLGQSRL